MWIREFFKLIEKSTTIRTSRTDARINWLYMKNQKLIILTCGIRKIKIESYFANGLYDKKENIVQILRILRFLQFLVEHKKYRTAW